VILDFLNVDEITKALKIEKPPEGGFNCLELFLRDGGFAEAKQRIEPLRLIQNLRSACAAHTKGDRYRAAIKSGGLEGLLLVEASMKAFQNAVNFVEWVRSEALEIKDTRPSPLHS